jgi:hypothetical protein
VNTHKGRLLLRAVAEKNHATRSTVAVPGDNIGGVWFPWDGEKGEWVKFDMTLPEQAHGQDDWPNKNASGVHPGKMEYMAKIGYIELVELKAIKIEE